MDENFKIWKRQARSYQQSCCNSLGDRVYDRVNDEQLTRKVGYAIYNAPSDFDENNKTAVYTKAQNKQIKLICDKLKSLQPSEDGLLYFSCLYVIVRMRNKKNEIGVQVLFRIPKIVNGEMEQNCNIFIDQKPRVYENWDFYLQKNKLPKCDMCFPRNGVYTVTDGIADLAFAESPACCIKTLILNSLDVSSTLLLVGATGVTLTSLLVPIALPVVYGATATVIASGTYETARTSYRLHDMKKHGESLGFKNPDARSAWLNLAGSIVGIASIGTTAVAKGVIATESALSRAGILTLRVLNVSSLAVSGIGVLNGIITLVIKHINGDLETKDIVNFTYVCLFFLNAVVTYNVASKLIEQMASSDINNLFNLRENSCFQFTKDIMNCNDLTSLNLLQQLISGAKSIFCPDISTDDLESATLNVFVLIMKLSSGKMGWEYFTREMIYIFLNIWKRYQPVIMNVFEEIRITFDVPYWQTLLPRQTSSNLEIPRLMCQEIDRVVLSCGITHHSNEHRNLMTFARAFSTVNKNQNDDEFINRFKFYCDCILAQFREEKEIYECLLDSKIEDTDFNRAEFDKSLGIQEKKEDYFFSNALDKVNHPDFLGNIDELYENLPCTKILNTHLPFLETTKSKIYTCCGPFQKSDLEDEFYWEKTAELTGFILNNRNCTIRKKDNLVLIQPKEDQDTKELAELEAVLINTSLINQCHMGLLLMILK